MKSMKVRLLSGAALPVIVGAGIAVGGGVTWSGPSHAVTPQAAMSTALPAAKPRTGGIQLAACNPCNPCAARNPCNPCAAKNPCNPCAANPCNPCAVKAAANPCNPCAANPCNPCAANPCNPCNPCAAGGGAVSNKCFVPRLRTAALANPCAARNPCNPCAANPCNPCAAKNPCNPCAANPCNPCAAKAAANPCNPCAAKNPCNPCAAANPCNPCAANPCNPCAAGAGVEVTEAEAKAVYDCLIGEMTAAYERAGLQVVGDYTTWSNFARVPYQSATHGNRYVNNYVNKNGAFRYVRYEEGVPMPVGTVTAKDSFVVNADGSVSVGPLFVMEKVSADFNAETGNWRYSMVMPDGSVFGMTKGQGAANVQFCNECHATVAEDQDYMMFLPEELRVANQ